jgi:hypothetical protein
VRTTKPEINGFLNSVGRKRRCGPTHASRGQHLYHRGFYLVFNRLCDARTARSHSRLPSALVQTRAPAVPIE